MFVVVVVACVAAPRDAQHHNTVSEKTAKLYWDPPQYPSPVTGWKF